MPVIVCGGTEKTRQRKLAELLAKTNPDKASSDLLDPDLEQRGIEDVRGFISWLTITPGAGKIRTLILREADKFGIEAQNAMLKTLEELPENSLIILEVQSLDSLLPTIVSRCIVMELVESGTKDVPKLSTRHNDLLSGDLGNKFHLAQDLSKDRKSAVSWLNDLMLNQRGSLATDPLCATRIKLALQAKKMLLANTNIRLTLENLFLNW